MPIARFKKNGGAIIARLASGFAQPGACTFLLWGGEPCKVLERHEGDINNPNENFIALSQPNEAHDDRQLDCSATLTITPPILDYSLRLMVTQDGVELLELSDGGQSDSIREEKEWLIDLVAE